MLPRKEMPHPVTIQDKQIKLEVPLKQRITTPQGQ